MLLVDTICFGREGHILLNIDEKMPFRKIVILAKLLLCEISSSKVNKMRSPPDEKEVFAK